MTYGDNQARAPRNPQKAPIYSLTSSQREREWVWDPCVHTISCPCMHLFTSSSCLPNSGEKIYLIQSTENPGESLRRVALKADGGRQEKHIMGIYRSFGRLLNLRRQSSQVCIRSRKRTRTPRSHRTSHRHRNTALADSSWPLVPSCHHALLLHGQPSV